MARKGFTLIELLIAIGIILILTALLAMGLRGLGQDAKNKAAKALIDQITVALENYHAEFRAYPPDGYDQAPGWSYDGGANNHEGVDLTGLNRDTDSMETYSFRGTSALLYFLCRPIVKLSYIGNPDDPRNAVRKKVGPFLVDLKGSYYSVEEFDPACPWGQDTGDVEWEVASRVEIVGPFGRPLHYDNVKTTDPLYYQPGRFHFDGTGSVSGVSRGGVGQGVHPHDEYLAGLGLAQDMERVCPEGIHDESLAGLSGEQVLAIHPDPRYANGAPQDDGCQSADITSFPDATGPPNGTHAPKYVGGFDLWSHGQSYSNVSDDVTSWEDRN